MDFFLMRNIPVIICVCCQLSHSLRSRPEPYFKTMVRDSNNDLSIFDKNDNKSN